LYILDEPTTGLHPHDIKKLIWVLRNLVDKGNTVVVTEHNLEFIASSDYCIDLGPEGGDKGGQIVAQGTPKEITKVKKSYTGQFLKKIIS
jgi:excinuclease ABC subunit A